MTRDLIEIALIKEGGGYYGLAFVSGGLMQCLIQGGSYYERPHNSATSIY